MFSSEPKQLPGSGGGLTFTRCSPSFLLGLSLFPLSNSCCSSSFLPLTFKKSICSCSNNCVFSLSFTSISALTSAGPVNLGVGDFLPGWFPSSLQARCTLKPLFGPPNNVCPFCLCHNSTTFTLSSLLLLLQTWPLSKRSTRSNSASSCTSFSACFDPERLRRGWISQVAVAPCLLAFAHCVEAVL